MTGSAEAAAALGWNILGCITIIAWTGALTFIMFYTLKVFDMLRVESGFEFEGKSKLFLLMHSAFRRF